MSLQSRLAKLERMLERVQPPPTRFVGSGRFWQAISGLPVELTEAEAAEFVEFEREAGVGPDGSCRNLPQEMLDAIERQAEKAVQGVKTTGGPS